MLCAVKGAPIAGLTWYASVMKQTDDDKALSQTFPTWEGRAIMLVDLDAFFASVEQLDHPEWRGKPLIVGGDADRRGVVSTASYEARAFGVHSAMASATARRLCPDAIWTRGNFKRYREMSDEVMSILLDESPLLQQVSIDEAFLDVSPGRYSKEHPVAIANRIRERVAKLGITCSVGLGTSKTVSKIASERDKPNGITVVFPRSEQSFLAPLSVRTISGIGHKTESRLKELGILTLGDISDSDKEVLEPIFGINTSAMIARCRGIDPVEVEVDKDVKSVSNEMTFSTDLIERTEIEAAVSMLAAKVGRRLRKKGLAGHTVVLKMRYADLSRRTAQKHLGSATDDEGVFAPVCHELIDELWAPGTHIRLVGVGIAGFGQAGTQPSLFDTDESSLGDDAQTATDTETTSRVSKGKHTTKEEYDEAHRKLVEATDHVKDRFGDDAVGYGRELRFKDRSTGTTPQQKDKYN